MPDVINFYLPDFFGFMNMNIMFISVMREHPEWFYDNIQVSATYGCFPGMYWNGGRCSAGFCCEEDVKRIVESYETLGVPIRFTLTNEFIDENLIHDPYCNHILEIAQNGKNEILVGTPVLEEYLRKTYPGYKYLSSTTKCLLDIDQVNAECEKYYLTVLDYRKNMDKEFIDQLKHIDKVELLINAYCDPECKRRKEHYKKLSYIQLIGSMNDFECSIYSQDFHDIFKFPTVIKVEDLYGYYLEKGFRHFKIEGRMIHFIDVLESYLYYMVKPDHLDRVRTGMLKNLVPANVYST